jgi:hypothetical protein
MTYYALLGFTGVVLALALGWVYLTSRLRRALGRIQAPSVLEEFDAGLNIPMRDGETRPKEKR